MINLKYRFCSYETEPQRSLNNQQTNITAKYKSWIKPQYGFNNTL